MQEHASSLQGIRQRRIHVVNLDPAAEHFSYDCWADVRDLISVTEVMTELGLGPNGALVYCMEYLLQHVSDWLCHDILSDLDEDDTVLLDCPGQVELVTHVPILQSLVEQLQHKDWQGHVVTVYCLDVTFVLGDVTKFWSGSLLALSAMIALEVPHVNLLTKTDLLSPRQRDELEDTLLAQSPHQVLQDHEYHATSSSLLSLPPRSHRMGHGGEEEEDNHPPSQDDNDDDEDPPMRRSFANLDYPLVEPLSRRHHNKWHGLTQALGQVLEDYSMTSFLPLNITDEDSVDHVLATVDHAIQHGESADVRGADLNDDYDLDDQGGDES